MTAVNGRSMDPGPAASGRDDDHDNIVVMHGVTWAQYEAVLEIRGERSTPRICYLAGELELMSPVDARRQHPVEAPLARCHLRVLPRLHLEGRLSAQHASRVGVGHPSSDVAERDVEVSLRALGSVPARVEAGAVVDELVGVPEATEGLTERSV